VVTPAGISTAAGPGTGRTILLHRLARDAATSPPGVRIVPMLRDDGLR
jgi:hypothetical protein